MGSPFRRDRRGRYEYREPGAARQLPKQDILTALWVSLEATPDELGFADSYPFAAFWRGGWLLLRWPRRRRRDRRHSSNSAHYLVTDQKKTLTKRSGNHDGPGALPSFNDFNIAESRVTRDVRMEEGCDWGIRQHWRACGNG